jgi:predicted lipid carrier protein YhbT
MEGDTELGLSLKNYLDGMDVESSRVLPLIESLARKTLPVYKRLFG